VDLVGFGHQVWGEGVVGGRPGAAWEDADQSSHRRALSWSRPPVFGPLLRLHNLDEEIILLAAIGIDAKSDKHPLARAAEPASQRPNQSLTIVNLFAAFSLWTALASVKVVSEGLNKWREAASSLANQQLLLILIDNAKPGNTI
jgi:hypothetical protein